MNPFKAVGLGALGVRDGRIILTVQNKEVCSFNVDGARTIAEGLLVLAEMLDSKPKEAAKSNVPEKTDPRYHSMKSNW